MVEAAYLGRITHMAARPSRHYEYRSRQPQTGRRGSQVLRHSGKAFAEAGIEFTPRKWSPERVIERIQDAYIKRFPLSSGHQDPKLVSAATRYFGSWHSALRAAGLKPQYQKWTKKKIVDCIRDLHRRRQGLKNIWNEEGPLACAAKHHFGGWHDALIAARVMTEADRPEPRQQWCSQQVIDEIRSLEQQGESLSSVVSRNRPLVPAAKRYFGTWGKALQAADVTRNHEKIPCHVNQ